MPTNQIYIQGVEKYVEISAGFCLVNGLVLYVPAAFRISDSELQTSGYGDYYIYLRPNRKIMESYYSKNYEYVVKGTTAGGSAPTINPDEILLGYTERRLDGSGNITLTAFESNRDLSGNATKRLIDSKDISYNAIKFEHLDTSLTLASPPLRYSAALGAITGGTPLTVTHSLGTRDILVQIYDTSTHEEVYVDVTRDTINTIQLLFANNYSSGVFRVVIIG